MPTYKLKLFEYKKIRDTWELEFDVTDQAKWDALRKTAESFGDVAYEIPEEAPSDPSEWFELIQWVFAGKEPLKLVKKAEELPLHDCEIEISTGYQLVNSKGKVLADETHDDDF